MTALRWPNLYVVGPPRAGTTSLYGVLRGHPDIFMSTLKEPHFFSERPQSAAWARFYKVVQDEPAYLKLFEAAGRARYVGDASTSYLADTNAADRIAEVSSDAKVVAVLRDPFERAHSHYLIDRRDGIQRTTFQDVLEQELRGVEETWPKYYIRASRYSDHIPRWQARFGANLRILFFEELIVDPKRMLDELAEFLDLPPFVHARDAVLPHSNRYSRPRFDLSRRWLGDPWVRPTIRNTIPRPWRSRFKRVLWIEEAKPSLTTRERELLDELIGDESERLTRLLRAKPPWLP